MKTTPIALTLALLTAAAVAGSSDLSYLPQTSGGHDFNHAPIGQSFTAVASDVTAGIYLADEGSFTNWLSTVYPGQIAPGSFPYAIAPSVTVRVDLRQGEGATGPVLCTATTTLSAPFSGFVDIDAGAAGVALTVGQTYTIMLTDVSNQAYPQGVTGWVVPAFSSYDGGHPVLQGSVVTADAGTGDNCFEVISNVVSGTDAVITAYVARNPGFIVINGGVELNDHLWTTNLNPTNTTFLDGLVNWYQTGLLVDYTGVKTSQGLLLTSLTVKKAVAPMAFTTAALATGTQGVAYSSALGISITGGLAPYTASVSGLPAGLTFDGSAVSGIPAAAGNFAPVVSVTDARGTVVSQVLALVINPPATPTAYTIRDEAKGKITAVGNGYIMVGNKKLIWNNTTLINVNTSAGQIHTITSFVKIGQRIEWKGMLNKATNTVLTSKLEIN